MNILILSLDSPFEEHYIGGLGISIRDMCDCLPNVTFHIINRFPDCRMRNVIQYSLEKSSTLEICRKITSESSIQCIHIFDDFFIEEALVLRKELTVPILLTFALSPYHRVMHLADFFKYISPEFSNKILNEKALLVQMLDKEQNAIRVADRIVFVSNYYKSLISTTTNLAIQDISTVIHNGIDFSYYNKKSKSDVCMPGNSFSKKVLYLGRLDMMKNISLLLDTEIPLGIELIVAGGDNTSGNGNNLSHVEHILKNNLRPRVHYIGFIKGEQKKWYLQNCDAVIVPSIHEPFGIVALEAMACKTLLICSTSSGLKEFVFDNMCIYCGVIPLSIRRAYERLLTISEQEKNMIVETAYDRIQNLSIQNNAKQYLEEYKNIEYKSM